MASSQTCPLKEVLTISQLSTQLAERLARPELLDLVPYESARRLGGQGEIWINANESPFNNTEVDNINRYPECQPPSLIDAYSQYAGVEPTQVVCGRGADEAIELLIRTFCIPAKDKIAIFGPTYGMYAISARTFNVGVRELALTNDYQLPNQEGNKIASKLADVKVVFICNPNNPTGTVIDKTKLESVIEELSNKIVVIDEAYIEFCPELSCADLIERYPNLVVLRTLSKAFALAGARCGFMLANSGIIDMVMRVIAPYPVSAPVAQIATESLSPAGITRMKQQVEALKNQGQALKASLIALGVKVLDAKGNYLLAKFAQDELDNVKVALNQAGIVARCYKDPRLAPFIRFSFSNQQDTEQLIKTLQNVLGADKALSTDSENNIDSTNSANSAKGES